MQPNDSGVEEIDRWWDSHRFGSGLKLMEHSWIGNRFVAEVEHFLVANPCRLVWAGDYADEESDGKTLYSKCYDNEDKEVKEGFNLSASNLEDMFVVNHTKGLYYKRPHSSDDDWIVNPLPLLTSEGNGRGGGDYHKEDPLVGSWARDLIEIVRDRPDESFEEIYPGFKEDW